MQVNVQAAYTQYNTTTIDLPEGKTWDDVSNYYIRYGTLFIKWKGSEEEQEFELSSDFHDSDMKFPDYTAVWDAGLCYLLDES